MSSTAIEDTVNHDWDQVWSEAEQLQLMAMCDIGVPFPFVVRALRRTPEDVLSQAWRMGLHITPAERKDDA